MFLHKDFQTNGVALQMGSFQCEPYLLICCYALLLVRQLYGLVLLWFRYTINGEFFYICPLH